MYSHFAEILHLRSNIASTSPINPADTEMPSILKIILLIIGVSSVKLVKEKAKLSYIIVVQIIAAVKACNKSADRIAV